MEHLSLPIRDNRLIAENMRELVFSWPEHAGEPLPGQFLTLKSTAGTDPLLRRPFAFSAFSRDEGTAAVIYQKRGKATEHLAAMDPGETVDVIGPLGNSFSMPAGGRLPVLAGGGIGLGPVLFFANSLSAEGAAGPVLILGARTERLLPAADFLAARLGPGVRIIRCTDDGSSGLRGSVLDGLRSLDTDEIGRAEVSCCGPTPMLRALAVFCEERGIPCRVSMEQIMACAVGACMGCVIRVRDEKRFARVCVEGPVFDAGYIEWSET